ncbi:MAG: glycosyltransferase [Pirellulales bacterium]|nr:glycosyltransferase [Pirellulales bacterium]
MPTVVPKPVQQTGAQPIPPVTRWARVLHLINGEYYSGAEKVQDLLAQRLPDLGVDMAFGCVKPDQFPHMRVAQDAPLYDVAMRFKVDLRPIRRLAGLMVREGYDLLHTHTPRAAMVGRLAAVMAGVPMVHHFHGQTSTEMTHKVKGWMNAITERISLTKVARVVAVSESLARYVAAQGVDESIIRVVPNGVPTQSNDLPPRKTPHDKWTIGTVALFRERKGLEVLLEASSRLQNANRPEVRLRIVGGFETPEYEAAVRRRVSELGIGSQVDWVGFTQNVTRELKRMDIAVLPSVLPEGLPMVIIEAMAAGVPVVGTKVDGVTDVIRDGVDGVLAEPGDAAAMAAALSRYIERDVSWSEIRKAAHRKQAERYSDQSMAAGVAEVYREILER